METPGTKEGSTPLTNGLSAHGSMSRGRTMEACSPPLGCVSVCANAIRGLEAVEDAGRFERAEPTSRLENALIAEAGAERIGRMEPTAQLVTVAISVIAAYGALAAWIVHHMDRRFAEAKADTQRRFADMQRQFVEAKDDTQRQFAEAKADTQRQFADMQRQFIEAKDDTQRQFAEVRADMQRGFDQAREDCLRLEEKMETRFDAQGEQIANLRQDVGRLQGIVERTRQPGRFTVSPVQAADASEGVRETRASYAAEGGSEGPEGEENP